MNIERNLHLFTKVEDALPKEAYWYLCRVNDYSNSVDKNDLKAINFQCVYYFKERNVTGWEENPLSKKPKQVTRWLDLSKLTTKEKAIELAEKAYYKGFGDGGEAHTCDANLSTDNEWDGFINKNIHSL